MLNINNNLLSEVNKYLDSLRRNHGIAQLGFKPSTRISYFAVAGWRSDRYPEAHSEACGVLGQKIASYLGCLYLIPEVFNILPYNASINSRFGLVKIPDGNSIVAESKIIEAITADLRVSNGIDIGPFGKVTHVSNLQPGVIIVGLKANIKQLESLVRGFRNTKTPVRFIGIGGLEIGNANYQWREEQLLQGQLQNVDIAADTVLLNGKSTFYH